MIIAAMYSHNGGLELMEKHYGKELAQIKEILQAVDAEAHRTKVSQEKTRKGISQESPPSALLETWIL